MKNRKHRIAWKDYLNSSKSLSHSKLRALIIGVQFDEIDLDKDDAIKKVIRDYDRSGNAYVDVIVFIAGMSRWIHTKFVHDFHMVCFVSNHGDIYAHKIIHLGFRMLH